MCGFACFTIFVLALGSRRRLRRLCLDRDLVEAEVVVELVWAEGGWSEERLISGYLADHGESNHTIQITFS